jgi:hypothetical protein
MITTCRHHKIGKKKHGADFSKVNVGFFCEFFFYMMMFALRVNPKGGDITKIRGVNEVIVKFTSHFGNVTFTPMSFTNM